MLKTLLGLLLGSALMVPVLAQEGTIQRGGFPSGTVTNPAITFPGTTGIYSDATHIYFTLDKSAATFMMYQSGGFNFRADGGISWSSTADATGGADTGVKRNAAGIVEIDNGGAGNFRDIVFRTWLTGTTTAVAVANVGANSCGTTVATIAGNENVGAFIVGATSGTQCRVTFTTTAANRRHCTPNDETTTIATRAQYVDATHEDFFGAFVAGDVVTYVCGAR